MEKKSSPLSGILTLLLYLFYAAIMLFIMFELRGIKEAANYKAAMLFEGIGFVIGALVILSRSFAAKLDIGFFIPVLGITMLYTVVLHVLCIILLSIFSSKIFLLVNLLLLFVYCLVTVPMVLMNRK